MDNWFYVQWAANIGFALVLFVHWVRLRRPPQEDPRLSRGLQLLQSKISVLEDLSDRTEVQYSQLNQLIEEKTKSLQNKILDSEAQLRKIDVAITKSLEVANIFQDKIPSQEVIERKNTLKYIEAARLAHQGLSPDEISSRVELPRAEIELITKVNREKLVFSEDRLPDWIKKSTERSAPVLAEATSNSPESLKKVGDEFRAACRDFELRQKRQEILEKKIEDVPSQLAQAAKKATQKLIDSAKRVEFPVLGLQQKPLLGEDAQKE